MTDDIISQIGAVTREVSSREHNGQRADVVRASRTYDTTIDDVWDAITNPERIPRWFLPISGDLRPGGRFQLEGNAGGEITECAPPGRLAVTWEFGGNVSWVEVELSEPAQGQTLLRLEHIAHVPEEWKKQFGPGAAGVGWDLAIMGLGRHLATGAVVDRKEAETWTTTEAGKDFVQRSSEAWCRAAINDSTPEAAARAAASRTASFYTGGG
ncbi:MAG: SRPBCC family protein [Alphaproteobacteria bacterium]